MTSTLIPFYDEDNVILITNSNVKHELSNSEYPTRRKQCYQAAMIMKKSSLREANYKDIECKWAQTYLVHNKNVIHNTVKY